MYAYGDCHTLRFPNVLDLLAGPVRLTTRLLESRNVGVNRNVYSSFTILRKLR